MSKIAGKLAPPAPAGGKNETKAIELQKKARISNGHQSYPNFNGPFSFYLYFYLISIKFGHSDDQFFCSTDRCLTTENFFLFQPSVWPQNMMTDLVYENESKKHTAGTP